jgi:MFS family permease
LTRARTVMLGRRLVPLYAAAFLQNLALWVPIEKLFMTSIGFDAASVGAMAAVYAVVVPVLEVPSGILADRWSRRGVLILASSAGTLSVLVGGSSQNVAVYMVSAAFLGVFFALQSGTLESVVYDTVVEETGASEAFEQTIGRVRLVESVALVASALAGGAIAQIATLRATYFLTAPLLLASTVVLLWFREPRLHQVEERQSVRRQVATTYRTILARGQLRAVVALTVVGSVLMQGMLEFGPLWLVALAVPAFFYGPHWAGLTAALGLGGTAGGARVDHAAVGCLAGRRSDPRLLRRPGRQSPCPVGGGRAGGADVAGGRGQHPGAAAVARRRTVGHPRRCGLWGGHAHVVDVRAVRARVRGGQRPRRG